MKRQRDCPEGQHGPVYNLAGNSLAKFRKQTREGLRALSPDNRRAYGAAVEAAILEAQRREAMRALPAEQRPNCASRSWANSPGEVGEAVRRQQRAALAAYAGQVRRARTPEQWASMYEEAMIECGKARPGQASMRR